MGPHRKWKRWPLGMAKDLGHSYASRGYFPQTKLLHSFVSSLGQQCRQKAVDTGQSPDFFALDHDVPPSLSEMSQPMVACSPHTTIQAFTSPKRKAKKSNKVAPEAISWVWLLTQNL